MRRSRPRWRRYRRVQEGMRRARERAAAADLVLWLGDLTAREEAAVGLEPGASLRGGAEREGTTVGHGEERGGELSLEPRTEVPAGVPVIRVGTKLDLIDSAEELSRRSAAFDVVVSTRSGEGLEALLGRLGTFLKERLGKKMMMACRGERAIERMQHLLRHKDLHFPLTYVSLPIEHGFECDELVLISEKDILGEQIASHSQGSRKKRSLFFDTASLGRGDIVVHSLHGVGWVVTGSGFFTQHDGVGAV